VVNRTPRIDETLAEQEGDFDYCVIGVRSLVRIAAPPRSSKAFSRIATI